MGNSPAKKTAAPASRRAAEAEKKVNGDGPIKLKLAHPMNPDKAIRIGIETEVPLEVGETVAVYGDDARALIDSGLVQVDPFDKAAVAEALKVEEDEVVVVGGAPEDPHGGQNDAEPPAGGTSVQS